MRAPIHDTFITALDTGAKVSVQFTKQNGYHRSMDCRWGPVGKTIHENETVTVWDVNKNAYRSIRPSSLFSVTVVK